jgi:hypothetical protein
MATQVDSDVQREMEQVEKDLKEKATEEQARSKTRIIREVISYLVGLGFVALYVWMYLTGR